MSTTKIQETIVEKMSCVLAPFPQWAACIVKRENRDAPDHCEKGTRPLRLASEELHSGGDGLSRAPRTPPRRMACPCTIILLVSVTVLYFGTSLTMTRRSDRQPAPRIPMIHHNPPSPEPAQDEPAPQSPSSSPSLATAFGARSECIFAETS